VFNQILQDKFGGGQGAPTQQSAPAPAQAQEPLQEVNAKLDQILSLLQANTMSDQQEGQNGPVA
jgi:hypothetical protein